MVQKPTVHYRFWPGVQRIFWSVVPYPLRVQILVRLMMKLLASPMIVDGRRVVKGCKDWSLLSVNASAILKSPSRKYNHSSHLGSCETRHSYDVTRNAAAFRRDTRQSAVMCCHLVVVNSHNIITVLSWQLLCVVCFFGFIVIRTKTPDRWNLP